MKVCPKCNYQLADDACFCTACGTRTGNADLPNAQQQGMYGQSQPTMPPFSPQGQQPIYTQPFQPVAPADNRKTYCILSYVGVLWLFGMLSSPEKFDRRVRFNVGQGILASIVSAACAVLAVIFSAIFDAIFTVEQTVFGYGTGYYETSAAGSILSTLVWLIASGISIFYMVYGIVKVSQNKDSYLPLIGKLSFYK